MRSLRFKSAIFEFKWQQQRRSRNLSYSPDIVQWSAHISSFRSPNAPILFFVGKLRQFPRTFMKTICSNSNVSNAFSTDKKIRSVTKSSTISHQIISSVKRWPPTQQLVIKSIVPSRGGHPLNNQSSISHQINSSVKRWPPTQQLVIKSIVPLRGGHPLNNQSSNQQF